VISSCEISSDANCLSELGKADTANVIVQGNQLFNLKEGVLVTSCTYGTVIANNYFKDVENKLVKLSVDTAKVAQPLMLMSDISDAAHTQPECTYDLWLDGENGQVCGWCELTRAAKIGDKEYATLAAAIADAKEGDTIVLLASQKADNLALVKGVTLDLNGYELDAAYLVAFNGNAVIDSVGGGLLKSRGVRLAAENPQMPVWVEEDGGYRFFTMKDSQLYYSQSATGFVFIAKPVLGKAANAPYMALANNGLSVKARMSWKSAAGNDVEQFFVLKGEDVQKIYSDTNQIIQLTVSGAGAYIGRLTTTMVIESETGVIWAGEPILYTGN